MTDLDRELHALIAAGHTVATIRAALNRLEPAAAAGWCEFHACAFPAIGAVHGTAYCARHLFKRVTEGVKP